MDITKRTRLAMAEAGGYALNGPFLAVPVLASLLVATLLAVISNSLDVFIIALGIVVVPLLAIVRPWILAALFLVFNLLIPRFP